MTENKKKAPPLGIKLIASLFLLQSASWFIAAGAGYVWPAYRPRMNEFIVQRAPYLKDLRLFDSAYLFTPLLAVFDAAKGLGLWFLQRWARLLIVLDLIYWLGGVGVAAVTLWFMERGRLQAIVSTPNFAIGFVLSVVILCYLFDPDVRRFFNAPEGEDY